MVRKTLVVQLKSKLNMSDHANAGDYIMSLPPWGLKRAKLKGAILRLLVASHCVSERGIKSAQ